jgi:glycosyltransferase involved in cell wall biosynthesis
MIHLSNFPVDSRVQRQAYALADRGAEIDCICVTPDRTITHGAGTIRLHSVGMNKRRGTLPSYVLSYASFFARAAKILARLDAERPFDLVEVHNMPNFLTFAGFAAKRRGAPVLLDIHDTFPELFATKFGLSRRHPLTRLMELEERYSGAFADAMLCVTQEAADRLNSRGVKVGSTSVVMNSPDEGVFGVERPPVPIPSVGPTRAIYHGGLATRFGIEPLIEGFSRIQDELPDTSLTVCGADHDTVPVVDLARRHGARNVFIEPHATPFRDIPAILAACHIGIVPTLHDEFTELLLPVKLLEYIHMGLPVVVSKLPVVTNYFSDDEVRFCEAGSAESLAEAVRDVIRDPEASRARAVKATERLRDIAWSRQRQSYLNVVDSLVKARATA